MTRANLRLGWARLPGAVPSVSSLLGALAGLPQWAREYFGYHGVWAPGVRLLRLLSIRSKMLLVACMVLVPALVLAGFALAEQARVASTSSTRLAGLRLVAATSALRVELGARAAALEAGRAFAGDERQAAHQRLLVAYQGLLDLGVPVQDVWERARVSVERALAAEAASADELGRANALALQALEGFRNEVTALAEIMVTSDASVHALARLAVDELPPLQSSLALLRRSLERLADSEAPGGAGPRRTALVESAMALASSMEMHSSAVAQLRTVRANRGEADDGLPAVRAYLAAARRQLLLLSAPALPGAAPGGPVAAEATDAAARPPATLDRTQLRQAYAQAREQLHSLRLSEQGQLDSALEDLRARATFKRNLLFVSLALGLSLTLYLMYTFYLVVRGGLDQLNAQIARMAGGDLSSRAMPLGVDEVATALRGMTVSLEHLSDLMASVSQGVGGVKHAAQQVASGNAELSSRNHQAAQGIAVVVDGVARNASQLQACGRQVEQVVESVQALRLDSSRNRKQMQRLRERMVSLRSKSREIGEVVTLIDTIAFRTNILALNASVEASKAGEAGRGFAVVAQEVRALANRGAESAHRIADIIRRSAEDIELSHALVEEAGAAMAHADRQVDDIHGAMDSVAGLTRAGEKESGELLNQLTELKRSTGETLNLVEQVANASDSMRSQGERLAYKLGRFKLS